MLGFIAFLILTNLLAFSFPMIFTLPIYSYTDLFLIMNPTDRNSE